VLFGVGTLWVLLQNGVMLGVVGGLAIGSATAGRSSSSSPRTACWS
jgi:uncharacterized membrane protein SpoIIM required for sporulation